MFCSCVGLKHSKYSGIVSLNENVVLWIKAEFVCAAGNFYCILYVPNKCGKNMLKVADYLLMVKYFFAPDLEMEGSNKSELTLF